MTDNEAELIKRAQAGETDAFCELARLYGRRIYSLALRYCHNAQDAEDLSQEVWLKTYQAIGSFRFGSTFYTWLRKITINTFLNHDRKRVYSQRGVQTRVEFVTTDVSEREPPERRDEEGLMVNKILMEKVIEALNQLSPKQRLVLLLKHHEGMTYEEIASAIGCSTGTVKKALARAVAKLRAELDAKTSESGLACVTADYGTGVCDAS